MSTLVSEPSPATGGPGRLSERVFGPNAARRELRFGRRLDGRASFLASDMRPATRRTRSAISAPRSAPRIPLWAATGREGVVSRAGSGPGDGGSLEDFGLSKKEPERGPHGSDLDGSLPKRCHFSSQRRIRRQEPPRGDRNGFSACAVRQESEIGPNSVITGSLIARGPRRPRSAAAAPRRGPGRVGGLRRRRTLRSARLTAFSPAI